MSAQIFWPRPQTRKKQRFRHRTPESSLRVRERFELDSLVRLLDEAVERQPEFMPQPNN